MNDETRQQEPGHERKKDPPAPEAVGEETGEALDLLFPLKIERIENTEPGVLWGLGSKLIVSAPDTVRLYVLTHEQLEAACELNELDVELEAVDQEETDQEELETAADAPPALNAAARICVQLNRIAEALGADAIPFYSTDDLDDVGRVEFRLMDIAGALERLDLARPA